VLAFIIAQLFPEAAVSLFTRDETLARLTIQGLRIDLVAFPLVSLSMVTSSFFQSIRKPAKAIFLSLTRQVIFLIPSLLIFPRFFGVTGVWGSMPVSDTAAFIVAAILISKQIKEFRKEYEING